MSVHKIRLAGPWVWSPVDAFEVPAQEITGTPKAGQTCQLPFRFDLDRGCSQVSLVRRFHCPTGISDKTTIVIALESGGGVIQVRLNGQPLLNPLGSEQKAGPGTKDATGSSEHTSPWLRFDVSKSLKPFNELHVLLQCAPLQELAELSSAALEIHE